MVIGRSGTGPPPRRAVRLRVADRAPVRGDSGTYRRRGRYRAPETREQLLGLRSADQVRTYTEHRETYDRLMGHT
ncbi:hypothetical protein ACFYWN_45075 [Streptomyces sp. NPDC002917]|uniref:hypothetical protein n=1 Tax=Streptomyces sp. NPDC002917 TaxID=3364671 RepID=UPI00369C7161